MAWHHPDRKGDPLWVVDVGNQRFHQVLTIVQNMRVTPENMVVIRNLIDALEFEYLKKKATWDKEEGIGADSTAVKKALKEAEEDAEV